MTELKTTRTPPCKSWLARRDASVGGRPSLEKGLQEFGCAGRAFDGVRPNDAAQGGSAYYQHCDVSSLTDRQAPADGSADTVNAGAFRFADPNGPYVDTHGPALRAIYDLADLDRSVFLTALGQSAHVLSSHYADLLPRWRAFNWLRLPRDPVGERLLLMPKR